MLDIKIKRSFQNNKKYINFNNNDNNNSKEVILFQACEKIERHFTIKIFICNRSYILIYKYLNYCVYLKIILN